MRYSWKWPVGIAAVVICVGAAILGVSFYRLATVVVPHSYAAWMTGDLLVEYLEITDGKWPESWQDLRRAEESLLRKGRNIYFQFERLPNVVSVDWQADPDTLLKAVQVQGESAIQVVKQLDGSKLEARWGPETEPNRKVARCLMQRDSLRSPNPEMKQPTTNSNSRP